MMKQKRKRTIYEQFVKRPMDFVLSLCAIIALSPILAITALLVRVKLGSPVLFKQMRPGKDEKIFTIYKFRTMTDEKDANGNLLPDDVRLTRFGKLLRSTSLDELPELFNILKGDMSIIGPRPQLVRDMVFMTEEQRRRHQIRPGLSGLAQVNGRNAISWEDKLQYDLQYIDNGITFLGDWKIIFQTVGKVVKKSDVVREGTVSDMDLGDWLLQNNVIDQEEYDRNQIRAMKLTKKKVLIVASVVSFIEWFNKENVDYLNTVLDYEVHIACNLDYFEDTDEEKTRAYLYRIKNSGVVLHNVCFARSPYNKDNVAAYKELKRIIDAYNFTLIHCHTPMASILTRLAARKARKNGTVVMYTCHGFHFHNKSSKKNWIIYYPVERLLSRYCDYIVTINKEDFSRAKTFHAPNVRYIPGVGVDIDRIKHVEFDRNEYRKKLGISENDIMLLSIGELIERKNHEVIIRALGRLQRKDIYYVICGKGPLRQYLSDLTHELNISENVIFLGFRNDIPELCNAADISAFPSYIEGLGLAGIEAMAAGVPLIASDVHGILDYVIDGETGFVCSPTDTKAFAKAIDILASNRKLREKMKPACLNAVQSYDLSNALRVMWDIYGEIL